VRWRNGILVPGSSLLTTIVVEADLAAAPAWSPAPCQVQLAEDRKTPSSTTFLPNTVHQWYGAYSWGCSAGRLRSRATTNGCRRPAGQIPHLREVAVHPSGEDRP
jgi:hypothetical protein